MKHVIAFLKGLIYIFLLILTLMASSSAQTEAELQKKYGKPLSIYEVRPGVMAVFKFDETGQVSEIRVERYNATQKTIYLDTFFSDDLIEEVINELAPVDKRGKKGRDGDTGYLGQVAIKSDEYENATIVYASGIGKCSGVVTIVITWKKVSEKQR